MINKKFTRRANEIKNTKKKELKTRRGRVLIIYYFHMTHVDGAQEAGNSDKISHHNDFQASRKKLLLCTFT